MADPTPKTGKSLYGKLAEVVAEVGYVAKDGHNKFQDYKYTSAEALLSTVRGPLSARGVVLMPSLTALSEREYTTSKGKASIVTTAHVRFTFVDSDSGETHECEWAGQGDDPADKGLGKAYTNAIKTFLREQFLIPQGDDPEADQSADERGSDRAPRTPEAAPPQQSERPASAKQRGLIFARAGEVKMPADLLANVILNAMGAEPKEFVSAEQADAWLKRAVDRLPASKVDAVLEGIAAEVQAAA